MSRLFSLRHSPLFLRIFALMLFTLVLVQALNFVVVILMPPPRPAITSLDQVVSALRGAVPANTLQVRSGAIDPSPSPIGPEAGLRRLLARHLSVPEENVRVSMRWREQGGHPPMLPDSPKLMMPRPNGLPSTLEPEGDFVFIGEFSVSAELDGEWRTAQLTAPDFDPWRWRALIWLVIAAAVVAPVAWLLARALARPIGLFADAARRLGRNPKAPPLQIAGPPEIREATRAFNEMQARVNRYVEDRATILAAIAHDLRTPLMRLNLRLESASPEIRENCEADIRDMEQMIAAVMSFVRDTTRPAQRQRVDARSLAASVTDHFTDLNHSVRLVPGEPLILDADPASLKALLNNLVGNAIRYADSAEVSLYTVNNRAVIDVVDNGPGIPPDELERAFEPFFRSERSRNRNTGGIGLGLASVRSVAHSHGGEAMLINRPEGGLIARVILPV